ncbi:MAG: zinc-dependent metalloprotease [Bacteroidetes bacterium]|nr:zinc-dependent metalloprotease [Bacteroidota bacterium]
MATLEEVLVPVYFFHRYQVEAVVKTIGGLNYRYALRGDSQPIAELLSPEQETKALDALIKTVDPSALTLPENILKLIPPRAIGYSRHRELVKIKTELTFDPVSAAETAADMSISLILHPARANRLVEHHARNAKLPGLNAVIDQLINATFKSPARPGLEGVVQMSTNYVLFTNLANLALNKNASAEARAIVFLKLDQLKSNLISRTTTDEAWKAHYHYIARQIAALQEKPDAYKTENLAPPPPGMPIGESEIDFIGKN